jgi:hypothetical protein
VRVGTKPRDVGRGRLHGGECGWERRANADTERGAGEPIHRRSCCTGNYKGALCNRTVHSYSALILCTHTLHSYSAATLCTHTLHSHSALTLCTYTLILCTHTLHSCSAFIIRTRTQHRTLHSYSTPVLCTGTLHSCSSSEHRRCHQWPSLWIRCVELSCERRKELCMSAAWV